MSRALGDLRPCSVLEVGCGNSYWLPYLAKKYNARVAGMDYSPVGCRQAESQLSANGVEGVIHCADMFSADSNAIGQFDFVYSLGLVEHFDDLRAVLESLLRFVRPGGTLFTEVPNLISIHGILSKVYQPSVLAKHQLVSLKSLRESYCQLGLESIQGDYVGLFSLNIVAWGVEPRWPSLDNYIRPIARRVVRYSDFFLCKLGAYKSGPKFSAPFIYVSGKKPMCP